MALNAHFSTDNRPIFLCYFVYSAIGAEDSLSNYFGGEIWLDLRAI